MAEAKVDTRERAEVRRALDKLKPYLAAYLSQRGVSAQPPVRGAPSSASPDIQALLKACLGNWEGTLSREMPRVARSYIHELIDIRNRWAHEEPFSATEAARAVDTARRFAELIGAPAPANTSAPKPSPEKRSTKRETQREVMIRLFVACGRDAERAILAYAAAEERGEVTRKSNKYEITAEAYARALLTDGVKKGWLNEGASS